MRLQLNSIFQFLDAILILLACSLAYWFRFDTPFLPNEYHIPTVILMLFGSLSLLASQHYRKNHAVLKEQLKTVFVGLSLAALSVSMFFYLTKTGQDFSRIWMGLSTVLAMILILLRKISGSAFLKYSIGKKNIVLLGNNRSALEIISRFENANNSWLVICEHFRLHDTKIEEIPKKIEHRRQSMGARAAVSEIWITQDVYSTADYFAFQSIFADCSARLVFIPELPPSSDGAIQNIEFVEGIATINSELSDSARIGGALKWLEDKFFAGVLSALLIPIFALIAIAIKLESKGPILFLQKRYGANGGEFLIYKFRTMHHHEDLQAFKQATRNDQRITRVGNILRLTSLDELPQLFNVLGGSMSLVGPRPHPNNLNEQYRSEIMDYMKRHTVKPGVTGLAQVNGFRGETSSTNAMEKRIDLDLEYIRHWSLFLDLKILALTLWHVVTTKQAY